jgi:hypothetical protein
MIEAVNAKPSGRRLYALAVMTSPGYVVDEDSVVYMRRKEK